MPLYIKKNLIKKNFDTITKLSGKLPAIVLKSDAYGLGIKNIVPILMETDCKIIFVQNIEEAIETRSISDKFEIIILNCYDFPNIKIFQSYNFLPLINRIEDCKDNKDIYENINVVLNIDLGMNRVGLKPQEIIDNIEQIKKFKISIIMSHLHATYNGIDNDINHKEILEFNIILDFLKKNLSNFDAIRISLTSSNVMDNKENSYDFSRVGKSLYGITHRAYELPIEEVFQIKEEILTVKKVYPGDVVGYNNYLIFSESYVGVVNIGYSSGLSLLLRGSEIKYKNEYYKIISNAMEYTMIDFGSIKPKLGDEVIFFPKGFVKTCQEQKIYYLEQLLRLQNMKKIVL